MEKHLLPVPKTENCLPSFYIACKEHYLLCLVNRQCYKYIQLNWWFMHISSCLLIISTMFSACFIWRNCAGSESDVREVWGWFSCSFCIKRISIPAKSGRAVLPKVEGTILYNPSIFDFSCIIISVIHLVLFNSSLDFRMKLTVTTGFHPTLEPSWNCDLNLVPDTLSIY